MAGELVEVVVAEVHLPQSSVLTPASSPKGRCLVIKSRFPFLSRSDHFETSLASDAVYIRRRPR